MAQRSGQVWQDPIVKLYARFEAAHTALQNARADYKVDVIDEYDLERAMDNYAIAKEALQRGMLLFPDANPNTH